MRTKTMMMTLPIFELVEAIDPEELDAIGLSTPVVVVFSISRTR